MPKWIAGREILDFGCGLGFQAVAAALSGAARVVGVDIGPLDHARALATSAGVADRVRFVDRLEAGDRFDVAWSLNSMEHFADPEGVVRQVTAALRPGGLFAVTFSPPWYAPYGAHMYFFTRVPWVHLLFSEQTVLAVRSRFRSDGARRYEEVEGGLNRMSLKRFERIVRQCGLAVRSARLDGVRGARLLTRLPLAREVFTNRVSYLLQKSDQPS